MVENPLWLMETDLVACLLSILLSMVEFEMLDSVKVSFSVYPLLNYYSGEHTTHRMHPTVSSYFANSPYASPTSPKVHCAIYLHA
jgi:hypothetical protein